MAQELSTFERELTSMIADRAQIIGWNRAIQEVASEYRVPELQIALMVDLAASYNDKADPGGRIHELTDYEMERDGLVAPHTLNDRDSSSDDSTTQ